MTAPVLVTGGTGRLGLIARTLLERGHPVRAMTRDPASSAAEELAVAGGELVAGDFDDPASLERAARGVDTAVAAGTAHRAGPDGETRHGINFAEAVSRAGTPHLIYISGAGAAAPTGVPVFDSKHAVEERIRALDTPYTIVAPTYFMENAFLPWNVPTLAAGCFPLPLPAGRKLKQVAIRDIAAFVAHVVENRERFRGDRIPIVSDELSGAEAVAALSIATGRQFDFQQVPLDALHPGMQRLFRRLDEVGEPGDAAELRRGFPEIGWHSFAEWAKTQDWPAS